MNTNQYLSSTKLTDAQRDMAGLLYVEYEDFIDTNIASLVAKYGGDFDDMKSEASAIFLAALGSFDNSVPFEPWLRNWLRWELIDGIRVSLTKKSRIEPVDVELVQGSYSGNRLADFVEGTSSDAKFVISLVLDTPADLDAVITKKGGQPRNYRSSIREYLDASGWSFNRVARVFDELKSALVDA